MTFLTDNLGEIVVLILSIVLAVVTEKWFPSTDAAQKHFWAGMLFIFSIVLGLSVKSGFEMNNKMKLLSEQVTDHAHQTEGEMSIHEVAFLYERVIGGASEALRKWGMDSQRSLEDDLKAGYIPISREDAPTTIADVYQGARKSIIASNVGSIAYYFDVPAYVEQNRLTRDRHVPVVRFFIYSNSAHRGIKLTKGCTDEGLKPDNVNDFTKCVNELTPQLGSLCSVIVDFDTHFTRITEARDLFIMDNRFVAETELYSEDWGPKRARATETPAEIEKDRKYFHTLWGITDGCKGGRMDDNEVRQYFPQFKELKPKKDEHLADAAFRQLMADVTGPE
jgi:hypothetical protein